MFLSQLASFLDKSDGHYLTDSEIRMLIFVHRLNLYWTYPVTALYITRVLTGRIHLGFGTLITAKVAVKASDRANGVIINNLDRSNDILVTSGEVTIQIFVAQY